MSEELQPLDPVVVETELGPVRVIVHGWGGVSVYAPHLTVDGVPLQAQMQLQSNDRVNWALPAQWDAKGSRFITSPDAIQAKLVDGRDADIIVLGRIAQVVIPIVRKLAETNPGLFLEAERRVLKAEIGGLEREIATRREKIQQKEKKLAEIEAKLPNKA